MSIGANAGDNAAWLPLSDGLAPTATGDRAADTSAEQEAAISSVQLLWYSNHPGSCQRVASL